MIFARVDPDGFTVINSRVQRTRFKVHIRVVGATWTIVDITMLSYDPTGQHSCIRISRFNGSSNYNRLVMRNGNENDRGQNIMLQ